MSAVVSNRGQCSAHLRRRRHALFCPLIVLLVPVACEPPRPTAGDSPGEPDSPRSATDELTDVRGGTDEIGDPREESRERAAAYREWLDRITSLERRLSGARAKTWARARDTTSDLEKWGEFAREFGTDLDALKGRLAEVQPLGARLVVAAALGDLTIMFHATAFQRPQEYRNAQKQYAESLQRLRKCIAEAEEVP